jgi:hypothetical protein
MILNRWDASQQKSRGLRRSRPRFLNRRGSTPTGCSVFCVVVPSLLSTALTDVRDLGPLVSAWVWPTRGAGMKHRAQWAAAGRGVNRGWNPAYGSILLLPPTLISFDSYTSWFLHSPRPSLSAMAAELSPSWFKTTASLANLRRLMGWQAPGFTPKLKHGAASLANMRSGDFVYFAAYALAGLVPVLSSFFLTLLEYYTPQLQHLSRNSIALVVISVHLYEMFMGVRPSVQLFRSFYVLKAVSQRPPLINSYYFQRWTQGHARYIMPVSPGRWERLRED